jgi:putative FmdB family regulatory protein
VDAIRDANLAGLTRRPFDPIGVRIARTPFLCHDARAVPTYDYQCRACGTVTELIHSMLEDGPSVCELCGGELRRVIYPSGIIFKGSGFYRNDSRASSSDGGGAGKGGGSDKGGGADKGGGSENGRGSEKATSAGSEASSGSTTPDKGSAGTKPTSTESER